MIAMRWVPRLGWLLLLFCANACSRSMTDTPTPDTGSEPPLTETFSSIPTPNPNSSTAEQSQSPEVSPEPTLAKTPLPFATLNLDASATEESRLWRDNAGCSLPCLWGLTPGVSSRADAVTLFQYLGASYVANVTADGSEYAPVDLDALSNRDLARFRLPPGVTSLLEGYTVNVRFEGDVVSAIDVGGRDDRYLLAPLLSELGQPDHVYVHVVIPGPDPQIYTFTLLIYFDRGISAKYVFEAGFDIDRRVVRACSPMVRPGLFVWSDDYRNPIEQEVEHMLTDPMEPPHEISDATGLTVAEFTRLFADTQTRRCMETPERLWVGEVDP